MVVVACVVVDFAVVVVAVVALLVVAADVVVDAGTFLIPNVVFGFYVLTIVFFWSWGGRWSVAADLSHTCMYYLLLAFGEGSVPVITAMRYDEHKCLAN